MKNSSLLVNNFLDRIAQIEYFYVKGPIAHHKPLVGANYRRGTKRPGCYCRLVRFLPHPLGPGPLPTLHHDVMGTAVVRGQNRTNNTDMRLRTYSEFCSSGLGGRFTGPGPQEAGVRRVLPRQPSGLAAYRIRTGLFSMGPAPRVPGQTTRARPHPPKRGQAHSYAQPPPRTYSRSQRYNQRQHYAVGSVCHFCVWSL